MVSVDRAALHLEKRFGIHIDTAALAEKARHARSLVCRDRAAGHQGVGLMAHIDAAATGCHVFLDHAGFEEEHRHVPVKSAVK